jgi:NTE family protein
MLFSSRGRARDKELDELAAPARPPDLMKRAPVIGLALGGGAARGWAHIGILRFLDEAGLKPDIVTGTSMGAVVGGCWAAGRLDDLEEFARSLTKRRVFGLMDFSMARRGLIAGDRLRKRLEDGLADTAIENLDRKFAAVSTEIPNGHEVWMTQGNLATAMRASYAIPGIFEPVKHQGRWLVDGVLVNPVPVSTARALGADLVIAVNLHSDIFGRSMVVPDHGAQTEIQDELENRVERERSLFRNVMGAATFFKKSVAPREEGGPGIVTVMMDAFNITQDRITRARLAGDPPDVMIGPKLSQVGLMEFHRADEAIAVGREAARRLMPEISDCFRELEMRRNARK